MVSKRTPLESLFYAGAHREVLKLTVDSATGEFADEETSLVVGALVFTGRSDEAVTVFRVWDRQQGGADLAQAAASRFFLCVAECRAGRYAAALALCLATLRLLRKSENPLARYYFHQGVGLVRHFTGLVGSAARHAARARRHALEARFPYGRMLALDLLGHALVQRGKVLAGLTVLEQAAELAEGIELESFALTTRSAIVAYRAHFGAGERSPIDELVAHLQKLGDSDRYSRRLVLTELAKAHAFRGEHEAATDALRKAEDVALPDGDRRASVRLYVAHALLAGLATGENAAREWLARASPLVDAQTDPALDMEVAWYEYLVCPTRFVERSADDLARTAAATGIARAAYLAAAKRPRLQISSLASEDRFAALVCGIREDERGLDLILAHGLLGLLPMGSGRVPRDRIWIDGGRDLFALEAHGNVVRREMPSEMLLALLRALARGAHDKESLIKEVWRLKVYRPEQHDAVVHTAVSRLRTFLEPHASWIQLSAGIYRLAEGIEIVDRARPAFTSEPLAAPEPVADAPDPRLAVILALVRRPGGAATRDIAEALKLSEMTAFRLLTILLDERVIQRTGRGRNTRYVEQA